MLFNKKHDCVIAAWCEHAAGPGWANSPVFVVVKDRRDGTHRIECLQPEEQTFVMSVIFGICAQSHNILVSEVEKCVMQKKKIKKNK